MVPFRYSRSLHFQKESPDADIFENKVSGYDQLVADAEAAGDIVGVTNPGFEVFLLLHTDDAYHRYIQGHEAEFFHVTNNSMRYPYELLQRITGMNSKRNSRIGELVDNVLRAIQEERNINQNIHDVKGKVTSNIGQIIESILQDQADMQAS